MRNKDLLADPFVDPDLSYPLYLSILITGFALSVLVYIGLWFYIRSGKKGGAKGDGIPQQFSAAGLRYFLVGGYDLRCLVIATYSALEKGVYEAFLGKYGTAFRLINPNRVKALSWDEKVAFSRGKTQYHKTFALRGDSFRSYKMNSRLKKALKKRYGKYLQPFHRIKMALMGLVIAALFVVPLFIGEANGSMNFMVMIFFAGVGMGLAPWALSYSWRIRSWRGLSLSLLLIVFYGVWFVEFGKKEETLWMYALLGGFFLMHSFFFERLTGYSKEGREILPDVLAWQKKVLNSDPLHLEGLDALNSYQVAAGIDDSKVDLVVREMSNNLSKQIGTEAYAPRDEGIMDR